MKTTTNAKSGDKKKNKRRIVAIIADVSRKSLQKTDLELKAVLR